MKRVLIVGGGSSGWMAAAYLDAALNAGGRKIVDVSLVESASVPRIGVGEATVPSINHVLAVTGIEEREFMKAVDGTYKQAIKFVDWLHGDGDAYYHAFGRFRPTPIDHTGYDWFMSDRSIPFMETVSAQPVICDRNLAPKLLDGANPGSKLIHAFHMNALKFADLLCRKATDRGVEHHVDDVLEVDVAESGEIAAVMTASGKRLTADLFIDCTGFGALLIEKALDVRWIDCSEWLLCDRAVTMHVPYQRYYPGHVRPYTTATALSAGWVWDIPLQDKRSLGYVHAGSMLGEDEAERELRRFEGAHAYDLPSRIVPFKVGRREKAWVGNCVAIGLAGGFIEPLESTGLYLSELAAAMLAEHFPIMGEMAPLAFRFNRIMANRFYEILDFVNLHYCLTRRTDSDFWRETRRPARMTDRLRAKLEYWKTKPPSAADFQDQFLPGQPAGSLSSGGVPGDHRPPVDTGRLFTQSSYEAILYGMDFRGDEYRAEAGTERPPARVVPPIAHRTDRLTRNLPTHEHWLRHVLGMPAYGR